MTRDLTIDVNPLLPYYERQNDHKVFKIKIESLDTESLYKLIKNVFPFKYFIESVC